MMAILSLCGSTRGNCLRRSGANEPVMARVSSKNAEDRDAELLRFDHLAELLHQQGEAVLGHCRNGPVIMESLAEQRMRPMLDGVGLEHAIHAEAFARCAQQRDQ